MSKIKQTKIPMTLTEANVLKIAVEQGVIESAISKKNSLYQNNHTLAEVKSFFKKANFLIKKIETVAGSANNEVNIHKYLRYLGQRVFEIPKHIARVY